MTAESAILFLLPLSERLTRVVSKQIKRVGLKVTASIHARHVKYWRGVALADVNLELKSSQIIRFLLSELERMNE